MLKRLLHYLCFAMLLCLLVGQFAASAFAQGTAFTYQGKLVDNGNPANGPYDFQFKLFGQLTGGTQQATQTAANVTVSAGIFTVQLDFGVCANCFNGSARFLDIAVKKTSDSTFTPLSPRQPVTANPYAIRSLAATAADGLSVACVSCVTSSQIQNVQGSQVSGNIAGSQINGTIPVASVPSGSANYIQNTTSQQATTNFNISGNGDVGGTLSGTVVNAGTQFNIAGGRVLMGNNSLGGSLYAGFGAGNANTTGGGNSFFGNTAGASTTMGNSNSFFGYGAGKQNTVGQNNSFFGTSAGALNTASDNSFFGVTAGLHNTTGGSNTFIGRNADFDSSSATGDGNTLLGANAIVNTGLDHATAIGYGARVTRANSLVLGESFTAVGIGTTAPQANLHVNGDVLVSYNLILGTLSIPDIHGLQQICVENDLRGYLFVGCPTFSLGASLRHTTDLSPFAGGMNVINRLKPISFTWKDGGKRDIGLGAEDVAEVEPLFTLKNEKGEIDGVKYDRLSIVFINAFKEQQAQIAAQLLEIETLKKRQQEFDALKSLVCADHPVATVCKSN